MNQLLIDNSLILLAIVVAACIIRFSKNRKTTVLFSFFILFPPLLVFLNMWAHTVAVLIVNIKRYTAGTFHYDFLIYSHFLFGFAFIYLSGLIIHCGRKRIAGNKAFDGRLLLLNVLMAVSFFPAGFINPLGFMPVMAATLSIFTIIIGKINANRKRRNSKPAIVSVIPVANA